MSNKNTPQIRFKDFTDAWEQRKLGDLGETFSGLAGKSAPDFGHGEARFVTYMNVYKNPVALKDLVEAIEIDKNQNEVKKGDVLFTTSSETPDEVAMSSVWLQNTPNTYLNSFCFGYRPKVEIDSYFLAYLLRADSFRKDAIVLAQGISRYNISKNGVMNISISVPSIAEQARIGAFFRKLDDAITLHQRKCEKLKKIKSAFLSDMFPKNGESVPKRRFKGFTDAWEQRKFSDIANRKSSLSDLKHLPRLEYEDINAGQGTLNKDLKEKKSSKIGLAFEPGDVLFGKLRPYLKNWFFPDFKGIAVGDWWVLQSDTVDSQFLYYLIQTDSYMYAANLSAGSKMPRSDWNLVSNTVFFVPPSKSEQVRIGTFFRKLDDAITLHQRKCEKLKKIKAAYLKAMFV